MVSNPSTDPTKVSGQAEEWVDDIKDDNRDLSWATVLKRTFEAYIRGERPNMYGEYLVWS
jgi:WD repeat and SOF domain-containing protein 1